MDKAGEQRKNERLTNHLLFIIDYLLLWLGGIGGLGAIKCASWSKIGAKKHAKMNKKAQKRARIDMKCIKMRMNLHVEKKHLRI